MNGFQNLKKEKMIQKDEILKFIEKLDNEGERIIDILLEVQRIYQLDVNELTRLLTKKQKEKLTEQELKLKNIIIKDKK